VTHIDERVPLLHGDMYETLGQQWKKPGWLVCSG
jgi:hypothetical protein